jgi:hypothetical protein
MPGKLLDRPGEPTVSLWIAEIHFEPRAAGQAQALLTPRHTGSADPVRYMIENVEDKVNPRRDQPGCTGSCLPALGIHLKYDPSRRKMRQTADLLKLRLAGSDMEPKTIPAF